MNLRTLKILATSFVASLLATTSVLAQSADDYRAAAASRGGGIFALVELAVLVLVVVGMWKVFTKAGQPGWASIIPIYNLYILLKIVGRPGWWLILFIIPLVNFVMWIIVALDLAKSFGKSPVFAVGLMFLSFIFIPILGFGDATYKGAAPATV